MKGTKVLTLGAGRYVAINVMPHPPQCGFGVGLAGAIDE